MNEKEATNLIMARYLSQKNSQKKLEILKKWDSSMTVKELAKYLNLGISSVAWYKAKFALTTKTKPNLKWNKLEKSLELILKMIEANSSISEIAAVTDMSAMHIKELVKYHKLFKQKGDK